MSHENPHQLPNWICILAYEEATRNFPASECEPALEFFFTNSLRWTPARTHAEALVHITSTFQAYRVQKLREQWLNPQSVPAAVVEKRKRDGRTIIDTVANFVRRFVFLRDKTYYTLVAAWILASHLHKKFEYLGYLFAYSPERQSGKTTLLELLNLLVCESTGLQISPTEAVMFRTAEGHTHLLDEVDRLRLH